VAHHAAAAAGQLRKGLELVGRGPTVSGVRFSQSAAGYTSWSAVARAIAPPKPAERSKMGDKHTIAARRSSFIQVPSDDGPTHSVLIL